MVRIVDPPLSQEREEAPLDSRLPVSASDQQTEDDTLPEEEAFEPEIDPLVQDQRILWSHHSSSSAYLGGESKEAPIEVSLT